MMYSFLTRYVHYIPLAGAMYTAAINEVGVSILLTGLWFIALVFGWACRMGE